MKRYEKYKPSGIEWIGEIPAHWRFIRLKYIGFLYGGLSGKTSKDFNQPGNPDNKPFIPFTNIANNKVVNPNQLQYVVIKKDEKQNQVKKGDLFFMMSSENYEDVGKSAILLDDLGETYLNSFCKGFRLTKQEYFPSFINYLLLSKPYRNLLQIEANGFTRINLKIDKVNNLCLIIPPLKEQTAIADYLDRKTAQIDELIAGKKRLLELYEEEKTAIINQAVTKGINPDVPMKDSGIEWIGEIPAHWEVKKVKYIAKLQGGYAFTSDLFGEKGIPVIRIGDIQEPIEWKKCKRVPENLNIPNIFVLQQFDTLIALSGATTGKMAFISEKPPLSYINQRVARVRYKNKFLYYVLISDFVQRQIRFKADGSAQENISNWQIEVIEIAIPPLEEQTAIVEYIEKEIARINTKVEKTKKLIELLEEYKQALISEVVTGKIKVV